MCNFLALVFRCLLALCLGCLPVANAFAMGANTAVQENAREAAQEDAPPCHTHSQERQDADGKCCSVEHCHCAMANALPAQLSVVVARIMPSDHPQTVRPLTLQQSVVPDTPPPRA